MSSSQELTQSGGLVPSNVTIGEDSNTLIVTAADNWDHNEHTLSGKRSTHAISNFINLSSLLCMFACIYVYLKRSKLCKIIRIFVYF